MIGIRFFGENKFSFIQLLVFLVVRSLIFLPSSMIFNTTIINTIIINSINNYMRMNLFNLIIRWIFTQKTVSLWELSQLGLPNFINFMAARYWVRQVPVIGQAVEYSLTPLMYYISCLGVHNIIASSWQTF